MKKNILILIGLILLLLVLAFLTGQFNPRSAQESGRPIRATLSGEQVCLPHKDTSGPTTLECAFGIRTESGEYYALNFNLSSQVIPEIPNGVPFSAEGVITPVTKELEKYNIVGVFSVTNDVRIGTATVPPGPSELVGAWVWKQTLLMGGEKKYPRVEDAFTLTFKEDGSVNGTTDCNSFFGGYTLKNKALTFTPFAMTKMFCEGSQEAEFVGMVGEVDAYLINPDGELVLHLKGDRGSVVFIKK